MNNDGMQVRHHRQREGTLREIPSQAVGPAAVSLQAQIGPAGGLDPERVLRSVVADGVRHLVLSDPPSGPAVMEQEVSAGWSNIRPLIRQCWRSSRAGVAELSR